MDSRLVKNLLIMHCEGLRLSLLLFLAVIRYYHVKSFIYDLVFYEFIVGISAVVSNTREQCYLKAAL